MRVFSTIQQVCDAAKTAEEIGISAWTLVDQGRVNQFAAVTGDHQWIHVDVDRAQDSPFGGTIVHGYFTLSLLAGLSTEIYRFDVAPMRLNYGVNRVRFPSSLPVGSWVRDRVAIVAVEPTAHGHLVTLKHTLEVKGAAKPAVVAETLTMLIDRN